LDIPEKFSKKAVGDDFLLFDIFDIEYNKNIVVFDKKEFRVE